jgi:uncharacterized membrane protein
VSPTRSVVVERPVLSDAPAETRIADTRARDRALLAIVVVGAVLRVWRLGANRLSFDEAFTAMTARRPLGSLFEFLRVADSHPPFDYLLRLPFARLGASEFWIRSPSAACSILSLALFAFWMRRYGWAGLVAAALVAVSAFQILHGRDARMYAEMELIGVATAMTVDSWLRGPRRWQAPALGMLVLVGLLTHVSMFLLGAGLLVVPGRRTDREAWRWRIALALGLVGWAALWGSSFLAQAGGGHSDWIPHTTFARLVSAVGQITTSIPALHLAAVAVIVAGGVLLRLRDRVMARVWTCCFAVPVGLAAAAGLFAPVLLDRTLTVVSWGALIAIGIVLESVARFAPRVGVAAAILVVVLGVPAALQVIDARSTPDIVIRHMQAVAQSGDTVAVHPSHRRPEIVWPLAVATGTPYRKVDVRGLPSVAAIALGTNVPSGRVWLLEWRRRSTVAASLPRCAPDWHYRNARVFCLQAPTSS